MGHPRPTAIEWQACDAGGRNCCQYNWRNRQHIRGRGRRFDTTLTVLVAATNSAGSVTASSIATGLVGPAGARMFYISYSSGNDSNSGTTKTAAWQRAWDERLQRRLRLVRCRTRRWLHLQGRGLVAGRCVPVLHRQRGSGETGLLGIETDWFTGSSFTPPIFSAGGSNIAGDSDAWMRFINASGQGPVEMDGIRFTGWTASNWSGGFGSCAVISLESDGDSTADRTSRSMNRGRQRFHRPGEQQQRTAPPSWPRPHPRGPETAWSRTARSSVARQLMVRRFTAWGTP